MAMSEDAIALIIVVNLFILGLLIEPIYREIRRRTR
jgi:hypothetical protein